MKTDKDTKRKRSGKGHRTCPRCGAKVPSVILLCECGYHFQTHSVTPIDRDLCREGHLFRITHEASLPDYCVRCGRPTRRRAHKTFYWFPLWTHLLWILAFLSLPPSQLSPKLGLAERLGALVPPALLLLLRHTRRRSMVLDVPECDGCFSARHYKLRLGAALLLGGVLGAAVLVVSWANTGATFLIYLAFLIGCLPLCAGGVVVMVYKNPLAATGIDSARGLGIFKGASESFLARLPKCDE